MVRRLLFPATMFLVTFGATSCLYSAETQIAVGDKVVTTVSTSIMDEDECLLTLSKGTELVAEGIEGGWIRITAKQDEAKTTGWVRARHLARWPNTPEHVWIVSTRQISLCGPKEGKTIDFDYWLLGRDNQWLSLSREQFLRTDDRDTPTCFFIHGNRTDRYEAVQLASDVYLHYKKSAQERPFRFVTWSWPADRIGKRNRPDVQLKARRADVESYYLAQFINSIDTEVPISFLGHSFGAKIVAGALHVLGGGQIAGRGLSPRSERRQGPLRAVLAAAAMDAGSLLPGHSNGLALDQLDQILITHNGRDRALKWYRLMYGRGGPSALGYAGLPCALHLSDRREKIESLDVACQVGRLHDWKSYFCAANLHKRLSWYAFLEESSSHGAASQLVVSSQPPLPAREP